MDDPAVLAAAAVKMKRRKEPTPGSPPRPSVLESGLALGVLVGAVASTIAVAMA